MARQFPADKESAMSKLPPLSDHEIAQVFGVVMRHFYAPYQRVETDASEEDLARLLARVEAAWQAMGEEDAHWSVITLEAFRKDGLEDRMEDFLAMGRENVDRVAAAVTRAGLDFGALRSVIDYGCGVGRVSAAYAARGLQVTGVDISAAHLKAARETLARTGGQADFVQLQQIADIDALPQVDLLYSLIVLQHNPPPVIAALLRRLLRRVRPGGVVYLQLPTYRDGYGYDVAGDLNAPGGHMEMHVLPQPVLFHILREAGFTLLEVAEDASCWDLAFRSQVVLAQRADKPPALPEKSAADLVPALRRKNWLSRLNARRKALRKKERK